MKLNMEFDKKMFEKTAVETANRVLDEFKYNGKTIREWADLIANPKTNADRIRAMSDEELAQFLTYQTESCLSAEGNYWLDWLRQEAE